MGKYTKETIADFILDMINKIVDWGRIKEKLEKKYKWTKNAVDNSAYPPPQMFKILLGLK